MYLANFEVIYNSKAVDCNKKPYELGLTPNTQILMIGALSSVITVFTGPSSLKFWKRFRDTRSDGWYIGRDRWDGITFQPRSNIRVFGVGIFTPYPVGDHSFKYGYKYAIQAAGSHEELMASQVYEEDITMPIEPNNPDSSVLGEV